MNTLFNLLPQKLESNPKKFLILTLIFIRIIIPLLPPFKTKFLLIGEGGRFPILGYFFKYYYSFSIRIQTNIFIIFFFSLLVYLHLYLLVYIKYLK